MINQSGLIRYAVSGSVALAISCALFLLLNYMILSKDHLDLDNKAERIVDFIQIQTEITVIEKEIQKPQKQEVLEPMDLDIPLAPMDNNNNVDNGVNFSVSDFSAGIDIGMGSSLTPGDEDGDAIPIVRGQPIYPQAAAKKGLEGYVTLKFTISETGSVRDVTVIDANPQNVFERSAISAVMRYKYKPKKENGVAIQSVGEVVTLNFTLQQ
ncbi:energy transducer TonB [Marinicellulosiphila megalodicopiae]|uniref:energy transducer TonB n=1 Tax=Marinicellulosiphila megalodicopiae TaxID=2724896 RepID=UPI003BAE4A0A